MARSALGKEINMSVLASRNENVRAVGNMRVNARGDLVDSNNSIITNANQRVKSNYDHTVDDLGFATVVSNNNMHNSGLAVDPIQSVEETQLTAEEKELFDNDDEDTLK